MSICLDKRHAKLWCSEPIENIENYDEAVADKTQIWVCHHRLELHPDGSLRFTRKALKEIGFYEHRPARELIFLPSSVHSSMHNKADKKSHSFKGEKNGMYGRHHTEESRRKMSETLRKNPKCKKGIPKGNSRWAKYGLSRGAIENKLKLSRKDVEMLDKENKLMEVLHD